MELLCLDLWGTPRQFKSLAPAVHNRSMELHQVSVVYQAEEDRLLVRIRTRQAQLLEVWLTRRLMVRLWPALDQAVTTLSLQAVTRGSTVMPEAKQMMSRAAKDRSREGADFQSPFEDQGVSRPLGDRPMLVQEVDLSHPAPTMLSLTLRDSARRELALSLEGDLLNNVHTLLEAALRASEWAGPTGPANPVEPGSPGATGPTGQKPPPRVLN